MSDPAGSAARRSQSAEAAATGLDADPLNLGRVALPVGETGAPQRLGFFAGEIRVPEDFDRMGQDEIEARFLGSGQ